MLDNLKPGPSKLLPASGQHITQLDALRALAILLVWLEHYTFPIAEALGIRGSYGVWLFFTLSGYLITGILIKYGEATRASNSSYSNALRVFFARRFLRLFPAFYLFLFIAWCAGKLTQDNALWHLFYASNFLFLIEGQFKELGHLWSLAVEEQFYLIWPFFLFSIGAARLFHPIVLGIGAAVVFRALCAHQGWALAHYVTPLGALDTLMLGALLAWYQHASLPLPTLLRVLQAAALLAFPFIGFAPVTLKIILAPLIIGLCSSLLIELCVRRVKGVAGAFIELPIFLYLGKISYGLYLYQFVPRYFLPDDPLGPYISSYYGALLATAALEATLTIVIATLSWRLLEKPMNALKKSFRLTH